MADGTDPDTQPPTEAHPSLETGPQPAPAPGASAVVPGQDGYLPWWKLALALVAVWVPATATGIGLFSWWDSLSAKTPAVFATVVYVVACTVGSLMLAMVRHRPVVSALAIAVMTAVFAATAAAAPLYGHSYCQHTQHPCLLGVVPR